MKKIFISLFALTLLFTLTSCNKESDIYKSENFEECNVIINDIESEDCRLFREEFNKFLRKQECPKFYEYIDGDLEVDMGYDDLNSELLNSFSLQYNIHLPELSNNCNLIYNNHINSYNELLCFMTLTDEDFEIPIVVKLDNSTMNIIEICVGKL
jgi:hypothetical protein